MIDDDGKLITKNDYQNNIFNSPTVVNVEIFSGEELKEYLSLSSNFTNKPHHRLKIMNDIELSSSLSLSLQNCFVEVYGESNKTITFLGTSYYITNSSSSSYIMFKNIIFDGYYYINNSSWNKCSMKFKNCIFSSDHPSQLIYSTVPGNEIVFDDCEFTNIKASYIISSSTGTTIKLYNCELKETTYTSGSSSYCFNGSSQGKIIVDNCNINYVNRKLIASNETKVKISNSVLYIPDFSLSNRDEKFFDNNILNSDLNITQVLSINHYFVPSIQWTNMTNNLYFTFTGLTTKFLGKIIIENINKNSWEKISVTNAGWYIDHDGKLTDINPGPWPV
jgi:hypothetical protein